MRSALRAAAAAALITLMTAACGSGSTAVREPKLPHRSGPPPISIFEDETALHADPASALAQFQRLGADVVRVYVDWGQFAPASVPSGFNGASPASYPASSWTLYDEVLRAAAARHLQINLAVGAKPPVWAAGRGMPRQCPPPHGPCTQWKPSATAFGAFMHALALRYDGHYVPAPGQEPLPRVRFWSIWDEPNYGVYLAPQAVHSSTTEVAPYLYRELLDAAWLALRQTGHVPATDTILIGETAPRGQVGPHLPGSFAGMVPLRFIRALYCVDQSFRRLSGPAASERGCPATAAAQASFVTDNPALFQASGFADHPYSDVLAPNVPTPNASLIPGAPDYADFAVLGNLERTLDRATAAWGSHVTLPIYSTEYGINTYPNYVPAQTAPIYMNQAEYLTWLDPRIRSYDQYLLTDPSPAIGSRFNTGLEYYGGAPKPSYDAYVMPLWLPVTSAGRNHALAVWGCVRPADFVQRRTGERQQVRIQFARAGSGTFTTLQTVTLTDPRGYYDVAVAFPGSGEVRAAWTGLGQTWYSRVQAITLK